MVYERLQIYLFPFYGILILREREIEIWKGGEV